MDTIFPANRVGQSMPEHARELETRIRSKVRGWVSDFRLVFAEHGLILRGRARTFYAKQLAQHAVMAPTTLPIAANEIEVS